MFAQIVDTPSRTKVATFFLSMAPRSFHPEEVRKALGEAGSSIASCLKHMVKNGLVRSVERNGEVYYRLNMRYPYLEELRSFLVKKSGSEYKDAVMQELAKLNHTDLVVLTGLFTGQLDMPTDLVVVGTPTAGTFKRTIEKIEKEIRQEIYYTVFTQQEFEDRVNMFEKFTRDLFDHPHVIALDKRPRPAKRPQGMVKKVLRISRSE